MNNLHLHHRNQSLLLQDFQLGHHFYLHQHHHKGWKCPSTTSTTSCGCGIICHHLHHQQTSGKMIQVQDNLNLHHHMDLEMVLIFVLASLGACIANPPVPAAPVAGIGSPVAAPPAPPPPPLLFVVEEPGPPTLPTLLVLLGLRFLVEMLIQDHFLLLILFTRRSTCSTCLSSTLTITYSTTTFRS